MSLALALLFAANIDLAKLQAIEKSVEAGEYKKITSIVVARGDTIVYEKYFDGDADTLRNTRSATKSITAVLTGIAIDKHPLTTSTRVFPLFASKHPANLPVRAMPSERPYGRAFSYCTAGVVTLGGVLERTTKTKVPRFAEANLFAPLGIEKVKWGASPLDQTMTGGGTELRSRDLLKLAQLMLDGGKWNGKRIVSQEWVRTMTSPHARISDHQEYGYLWWLQSFGGHAAYFMTGNGGNKVVVVPDLDLAAVITSTNYGTKGMHEQTDKIMSEIVAASQR